MREADDAVRVGSYLDIDEVVAAAKASGADAVHPGYGFLSERAEFARAVEAAGLKLVGPSAAVMEQMGRKDAAREIAVAAGVPVVPVRQARPPIDRLDHRGDRLDGRCSSRCWSRPPPAAAARACASSAPPAEYDAAVAAAKREAASAFGDDTILVEKYVEHGRHIEVQVLADAHGNVVHLFERDCSTQRRHQKVLEEAPAPTITAEVRRTVTESAVALAAHVGYENAGTVEFLLDDDTGEVYFLEMNTRLQVEHPVTESVVVRTTAAAARHRGDRRARRPGPAAAAGRRRRAAAVRPGRPDAERARDRGPGLRRGPVPRVPAAGRHGHARALARPRPGRRGPGERQRRQHVVRPHARQDHRPRRGPRGRPPGPGRRARRHRDPRAHHQPRVPAGARRRRRVPRRRRSTPPGWTPPPSRHPRRPGPRLRRLDRRRDARGPDRRRAPVRARRLAAPGGAARCSSSSTASCAVDRAGHRVDDDRGAPGPAPAARRRAPPRPDPRRPPARGGRRRSSRHVVEVVHQGHRRVFERPDVFADQAPAPATARSWRRCRAPSSTSGSAAGQAGGRGRRAGRDGGDEDGAQPQGAVRRHRRRGRRRHRRPGGAWAPGCSWSSPPPAQTPAPTPTADVEAGRRGPRGGDGLMRTPTVVPARRARRAAARAGHDLRGRPARRPAERAGAGPDRGQGRVHRAAARRRAADRRGDQLRAPEVGAAARRRRAS